MSETHIRRDMFLGVVRKIHHVFRIVKKVKRQKNAITLTAMSKTHTFQVDA